MNKHEVDYLFQYNRWANARMLDAASKLTVEDFTKDLKSSHRSLRDTLSHTLAAEWIWLERWKGTSPKALLNPADFPTVESVRARWASVDDDYVAFINQLADASLGTVIAYTNTKGERWEYPLGRMMQHLANHSSYHRGQVTTMLRQLGAAVSPVDLLVFMDVQNKK
ncbi:MAG: DinB family protein [Blastocatellia bacterium]